MLWQYIFTSISAVLFFGFVALLITVFTPTKQTYLFMCGGAAVDSIVEDNPEVKELPGNTLNLLNEYIKLETEKIKKGKKD